MSSNDEGERGRSAPRGNGRGNRLRKVTLRDVAAAAGVSTMTVSNVLNDKPNVGKSSRERVNAAIHRLGYVPNRAAQQLAGEPDLRIGLLYTGVLNSFAAALFIGSVTAASSLRAEVSIRLAGIDDPKALRETLHRMRRAGVEGFLLPAPIAEAAALAFEKEALDVPAVAIATGFPIPGMASVRCDDRRAAFELVSMLLDLGHVHVGHITGPTSQSVSIVRREGYGAALLSRGIEPRPELVVESAFNFQAGIAAADVLLDREPGITAIFAANDTLAAGVIAAAHRRGLAVPEALSVVGYDDAPIAEQVWPALTTARQDSIALTERAFAILADDVRARRGGSTILSSQDVVLPHEIVSRASVARPRS
jgi:LacI family transcriptional regulator